MTMAMPALARFAVVVVVLLAASCAVVLSIDNGLGRTPPLGWRAWLPYSKYVDP